MARNLKVSGDAQHDLDKIYDHSAAEFGIAQAGQYVDRILEALKLILAFPDAQPRLHPDSPARTYLSGSHRILYETTGDTVLILRILHVRQLPPGLD